MKNNIIDSQKKDINGRNYYINLVDPFITFNREEITLAHLFREKTKILQNRDYATCLYQYLLSKRFIRNEIVEIGCGLGDLASGILKQDKKLTKQYILYDLSKKLIETQRKRLKNRKRTLEFIHDDCLNLSKHFKNFPGLILSNGMIADLQSVYLSKNDKLEHYKIFDEELLDFANEYGKSQSKDGWYLNVGTLLFIRQIAKSLSSDGVAVITEYAATHLNQPSFFVSHYECGIDFTQIAKYAEGLCFDTEIIDMEEILSISKKERFLSVDAFTSQDRFAKQFPISVKLWQVKNNLPVLAYTQETLKDMLVSEFIDIAPAIAKEIVEGLESCFHPLSEPKFDHINPTTWSYQCLLLKRRQNSNWKTETQKDVVAIIKELENVSEEDAIKQWNLSVYEFENKKLGSHGLIGLSSLVVTALIPITYNAYCKYGKKWLRFAIEEIISNLKKMYPDNPEIIKKIMKLLEKLKPNSYDK
jgi:SAM-dependent methyltransferase